MTRKRLNPPIDKYIATQITRDEIQLLRRWRRDGKIGLIRSYARWIPYRVWDEHVDVDAIAAECIADDERALT
jgi:hypothetical protein